LVEDPKKRRVPNTFTKKRDCGPSRASLLKDLVKWEGPNNRGHCKKSFKKKVEKLANIKKMPWPKKKRQRKAQCFSGKPSRKVKGKVMAKNKKIH